MRRSVFNLARNHRFRGPISKRYSFLRHSSSERKPDGDERLVGAKILPHVAELSALAPQELSKVLEQTWTSLDADWTKSLANHLKLLQPLPRPLVMHVLEQARIILEAMPNVIELHCGLPPGEDSGGQSDGQGQTQLTVVGDTHGQYWDLMNLLSENVNNFPSASNPYLFNGDMVDRGMYVS